MSEPVVVKLRKPIRFGDRVIDQLTIRPLKAKDLRRMKESDGPMGSAINFAGYLSGEVTQVIDELEGDDLREVIAAVNGFFLAIQGIGPTSSAG